ncbi:MAG: alpha/beta hydrolase [Pseudomonadota bacterium]
MTDIVREPYGFVHKEIEGFKDVYGGAGGMIFVEMMRVRPKDPARTKTAVMFSHPIGGGAYLPLVTALAAAGVHVLYCNPRFRGNDTALVMEKCVADLGAAIADAKDRFGYEQIVLGGWSGGGSLSLFYQDQAKTPTITRTPAGDPYDLTAKGLIPADGIMLLAAHVSRAVTLTEWTDPSILDEDRPFDRDPELDIYNPDNPNRPPYSDAFVERFRAAQIARNRRITARVKATLADLQSHRERCFTTHGTMADVRWTDPAQDPSDRRPHECYLGDPQTANDGPVGLARFATLRSWLSQWSYDDTNADGLGNAARITCPVLVLNNTADLACTPSHARRLFEAVGHDDKEYHDIVGADHYFIERPDRLPVAVERCTDWLRRQDFILA